MPQSTADFEREFERALAAYADPNDAGYPQVLAARVMAEVRMRQRKRRLWLGISAAAPLLGCMLVAAVLYFGRSEPQHREAKVVSIPAIPHAERAPEPPAYAKARPKLVRGARAPNARPRLPKLDQFPAPAPMSEQEKLLVQFVRRTPPSTQRFVVKMQEQSDEPLRIAELSIPDLDSKTQP